MERPSYSRSFSWFKAKGFFHIVGTIHSAKTCGSGRRLFYNIAILIKNFNAEARIGGHALTVSTHRTYSRYVKRIIGISAFHFYGNHISPIIGNCVLTVDDLEVIAKVALDVCRFGRKDNFCFFSVLLASTRGKPKGQKSYDPNVDCFLL